jgi:hypothetical protein
MCVSLKHYLWLLLLIPPLLSLKCERDCFPSKEPELKVIFSQATPSFQRVYGLGGNGNISRRDGYYYLPVSLRADSITYIFEHPPRTDTLTILYSRNFFYESERCGYEVELLESEVHTTFTQASVSFTNTDGFVERSKYEVFIEQ